MGKNLIPVKGPKMSKEEFRRKIEEDLEFRRQVEAQNKMLEEAEAAGMQYYTVSLPTAVQSGQLPVSKTDKDLVVVHAKFHTWFDFPQDPATGYVYTHDQSMGFQDPNMVYQDPNMVYQDPNAPYQMQMQGTVRSTFICNV